MRFQFASLPNALYRLQRYSAMALAPLVIVHLGLILIAARTHPAPADILAQFREQPLWPVFYLFFVIAVSVHAPIGLWQIWRSVGRLPDWPGAVLCTGFALVLLLLGARALIAMLA